MSWFAIPTRVFVPVLEKHSIYEKKRLSIIIERKDKKKFDTKITTYTKHNLVLSRYKVYLNCKFKSLKLLVFSI